MTAAVAWMGPLGLGAVRWLPDPDRPAERPWVVLADLMTAIPLDLPALRGAIDGLGAPLLGRRDPVRRIETETGPLVAVPAWAVTLWARAAGLPDEVWIGPTAAAWLAIHEREVAARGRPMETVA